MVLKNIQLNKYFGTEKTHLTFLRKLLTEYANQINLINKSLNTNKKNVQKKRSIE